MYVYAIELYPIATPNKWSKTVPKQKPEINIYGLITYGIDIPWAAPWVIPNEKIIALIQIKGNFLLKQIIDPRNRTENTIPNSTIK